MKATTFEFRFRVVLMVAILALGFWAPWIDWLHFGTRTTAWLWLGFEAGSLGLTATAGIQSVTVLMIAIAIAAAGIRVWGTAYLGAWTVNNPEMKADASAGTVMTEGPYRYVRNPLYIGSWLCMAAVSALMPASGALMAILMLSVLLFRLILSEEDFLFLNLGAPYLTYQRNVPRLFPKLRTRVTESGKRARWGSALLSEIMPIGVALSFAVLSWSYNADLLIRAVLISFGISLVMRALLVPSTKPASVT